MTAGTTATSTAGAGRITARTTATAIRSYYYDRPYYGYGSRYGYPPVYRSGYSYDCDPYYDYDCDDDGFSLSLSLPLH